jgi:pimeloyl-ACP methyl ester carboxylesterase
MGKRFYEIPLIREYKANDAFKYPTIILCNADANNMTYLIAQAQFLCINGFNVITFDWRGFGKSQKWKFDENIACLDFLKDYDAVLDTVIKMKEVDNKRIGSHSFSTGAYISFLEFAVRSEIKALAVRGMFTCYEEAVKNLDIVDPKRSHPYPSDFDKPEYRAIDMSPKITKPIFLIVGEHDVRTPPEMSLRLLSAVNSFVRDLWIVKGAEHGGHEAPEVIDWKGFKQRMIDFYKQNL